MLGNGSIDPLSAWLLPWDYALRLITTRDRRMRDAQEAQGGGGNSRPSGKVEQRVMSDGRKHAPGVSRMLAMFGM